MWISFVFFYLFHMMHEDSYCIVHMIPSNEGIFLNIYMVASYEGYFHVSASKLHLLLEYEQVMLKGLFIQLLLQMKLEGNKI